MITYLHFQNDDQLFRKILNYTFEKADSKIYPLNEYFCHFLAVKNYSDIKFFCQENPSDKLTINSYRNLAASLDTPDLQRAKALLSSYNQQNFHYVFVGSKKSFASFFPKCLPSIFDKIYSYLLSSGYISSIGSGHGSFILISSNLFSSSFDNISSEFLSLNSSDAVSNFNLSVQEFVSSYKSLAEDNEYLFSYIKEQEEQISSLKEKVVQLEYSNTLTYQTTWR
jgi:hypothetical protein